jgi:tRNA pseudouridine55 synthase
VTGLLGSSTDSYDSEGKRVRSAPFAHVTRDKVEAVLDGFRGQIKQFPPM